MSEGRNSEVVEGQGGHCKFVWALVQECPDVTLAEIRCLLAKSFPEGMM